MFIRAAYRNAFRKKKENRSCTLNSATMNGVEGRTVEIQAVSCGELKTPKPWSSAVKVSGMAPADATELLNRIGGALAKLGAPESDQKILLHFLPDASGEGLDVAVSMALLHVSGVIPLEVDTGDFMLIGKLDLHGDIRSTPGSLPLCFGARNGQKIICPQSDAALCVLSKVERDCTIHPVSNLEEVCQQFMGVRDIPEYVGGKINFKNPNNTPIDFADIKGQKKLKRALEISAASGSNILIIGKPGTGKTMSASALAGILPPLSNREKVELTRIWSAAGMIDAGSAVTRRPFRTIHHTATKQSIVGGGSQSLSIGEVTLAHRGVLFLDEVAEFRKDTLESLRQPMEDGTVRVSRVGHKIELPCQFTLVAAMNPCPCGYAPDCSCTQKQVERYQSKLSGPLLDRIDIKVEAEEPDINSSEQCETSEQVRSRVVAASKMASERLSETGYHRNSDVPSHKVIETGRFSKESISAWRDRCKEDGISMRLAGRIAKVARTIADLAGSETVLAEHISESFDFV